VVLFDMFDTLVRLDRNRLPAVRIGDREVRSSVAALYEIAGPVLPGVSLPAFHEAFVWSYQEAERRRAESHREIAARDRLELLYARLGRPGAVPEAVTDALLETHMRHLASAAEPMPGLGELLAWLAGRFRLGIVSNFDYSPTVDRILRDACLIGSFEAVIVSDAVGWRKPHATIFETALAGLGVEADDCLFVGDRPDIDVVGAQGVGMRAAWLNPDRIAVPAGLPSPDFVIGGLGDLRPILERAAKTA
jgi:putative hydrolase of the HAD superfamily